MIRIYKEEELYCEAPLFVMCSFLTDRMTWFDTVVFLRYFQFSFISTIIKIQLFSYFKKYE